MAWSTATAKAPTIVEIDEDLVIIGQNTIFSHFTPYSYPIIALLGDIPTKDEIMYLLSSKYPQKADLMACIARKESTWCTDMHGDNGLAYGCFQIHIAIHDITEDCAMDLLCSAYWTYEKITDGKGYLWSTYPECSIETNQY